MPVHSIRNKQAKNDPNAPLKAEGFIKAGLSLKTRLKFESLISELSARFVNLDTLQVDGEIERALKDLLEFFEVDQGVLFRVSPLKTEVEVTHLNFVNDIAPAPRQVPAAMFPWSYHKLTRRQQPVVVPSVESLSRTATTDKKSWLHFGVKSVMAIPVPMKGTVEYIISVSSNKKEREWPEEYIPRLRLIGEVFVNALFRKQADEELRKSFAEIKELKDRLQVESEYLRSEVKLSFRHDEIIGESAAIKKVLRQAEQVASNNSTVLITGETGTGKELVARLIHHLSRRSDRVMVKVNCAALPAALIESELFGREKGAYTGSLSRQMGRFELADGSTLFLDEISELPTDLQAKLLRVLQDGEFERLGSPRTIKVNVRVIAATNRNITDGVRAGSFRKDLYYRLNVFPIEMPPLRDRLGDVPLLVWAFVTEFSEKIGRRIQTIPKRTMDALQRYSWPGNVRELRNLIEHGVITSPGETLTVRIPRDEEVFAGQVLSLEEAEYRHIVEVLQTTSGHIKGKHGAAELLGLKPSTLYTKMKKLGIAFQREKVGIPPRSRNADLFKKN